MLQLQRVHVHLPSSCPSSYFHHHAAEEPRDWAKQAELECKEGQLCPACYALQVGLLYTGTCCALAACSIVQARASNHAWQLVGIYSFWRLASLRLGGLPGFVRPFGMHVPVSPITLPSLQTTVMPALAHVQDFLQDPQQREITLVKQEG